MTSSNSLLSNVNVAFSNELLWEGTFEDYLNKVVEYPKTVRTAHQTLYEMIVSHGSRAYRRYKEDVIRYNLFDDPFDPERLHAVYGDNVDVALMVLINTIKAASLNLGQENRMLLLHGPIGTAKSTIGSLFSDGLEAFSKKPEGQLFKPHWVVDKDDEEGMEILGTISRKFERERKDCELHEEPLAVLPPEVRQAVVKHLGSLINKKHGDKLEHKIRIKTDACPQCASIFKKFMRRYNNDWQKVVEKHLRVSRLVLSKSEREGIVVVRPKSEKDQDVTEFLGEHNFATMANFGSITDPRTFDFAGHYMRANRGMFYWEEQLKFALSFLYDLLGATQEHMVQPKGFREVSIDEVLIGSTNEPEYLKLKEDDKMQALRDRIIKIDIPYILELRNEVKIYEKFFTEERRGGKHLAPHTREIASFWALMTRVNDPQKTDLNRRGKIKLYNGQAVEGFNDDTVKQLLASSEKDGLQGISPRYIHDKISAAFMSASLNKDCVNFFVVLRELKEGLKTHPHIKSAELRKNYEKLIAETEEELAEMLKYDLRLSIVGDEDAIKELHAKYIDHVTAYVNKESVKDQVTGNDMPANEDFLNAIESHIENVPRGNPETFRQKIINKMHKHGRDRERDGNIPPFSPKDDETLYRAYQLYLFNIEKDKINWESLISQRSINTEGERKLDKIKERLIKKLGYCDICASEVMSHVAGIFHRGEIAKKN